MDKVAFSYSWFFLRFEVSNCKLSTKNEILIFANKFPNSSLVTPIMTGLENLERVSLVPLPFLTFPWEYILHDSKISYKVSWDTSPNPIKLSKLMDSSMIPLDRMALVVR